MHTRRSDDSKPLKGTGPAAYLEAAAFYDRTGDGIMIKAIAGGGGRAMRPVPDKRPTWNGKKRPFVDGW